MQYVCMFLISRIGTIYPQHDLNFYVQKYYLISKEGHISHIAEMYLIPRSVYSSTSSSWIFSILKQDSA